MSSKEFNLLLAGGALLLVIFSIFAIDDIDEAAADDAAYCGMVKDFKESNGKYGWPAYKGEGVCRGL